MKNILLHGSIKDLLRIKKWPLPISDRSEDALNTRVSSAASAAMGYLHTA
jgi:hypothetical protein